MLNTAVATAAAISRDQADRLGGIEPADTLTFALEAKHDYKSRDKRCLRLHKNSIILCRLDQPAPTGWAHGRIGAQSGLFPLSYASVLKMVPPRTVNESARRRSRGVSVIDALRRRPGVPRGAAHGPGGGGAVAGGGVIRDTMPSAPGPREHRRTRG